MKEYWTYRNFEECLEKVKYTSKISTSDYLTEGEYPIVSQEEGLIAGFWNNEVDVFRTNKPVVIFGDHTRVLKYVDFDFVLGADGVKILQPIDDLLAKFFLYYLKWYNIPSLGYSRHYKLLKEIKIPIPPLSTQSRIVSELDLLQSIIDKQQAQLKELDTLAQAVFYDMFGDPVENEKRWKVKTWNDIFETKTGKLNANAMVDGGKYPFFTCSKESFFINEYAFDCEALLLAGNNASAKYDVKYYKGKFNAYQRTYVLTLKEGCYPFFKISLEQKLSLLQKQSIGGLTKYLTLGILEPIKFILPPLSLQQSFAAKIESIEKQKAAISQSIAETQKLFDYTMDKYFGE